MVAVRTDGQLDAQSPTLSVQSQLQTESAVTAPSSTQEPTLLQIEYALTDLSVSRLVR